MKVKRFQSWAKRVRGKAVFGETWGLAGALWGVVVNRPETLDKIPDFVARGGYLLNSD